MGRRRAFHKIVDNRLHRSAGLNQDEEALISFPVGRAGVFFTNAKGSNIVPAANPAFVAMQLLTHRRRSHLLPFTTGIAYLTREDSDLGIQVG